MVTQEMLEKFLEGCQAICDKGMESYPNQDYLLEFDGKGRKYQRIARMNMFDGVVSDMSRSCFLFVDKTNGDVLKCDGWKSPAKGARGNLFDEFNGLSRVTQYGAEYNR